MARLLVALVLVAVVGAVAAVVARRRAPQAPTQPRRWPLPQQLDRADFARRDVPWLAVLFTSSTCDGCARVTRIVEVLASDQVAVQVVPWQERKDLHDRYGVEAVPCFCLADDEGVVRHGIVGSEVSATDLWAAVAEVREPGSVPADERRGQVGEAQEREGQAGSRSAS